jgi:hypothetical protein
MGMEASLTRTLKSMEDRGLIIRKKIRKMAWCIDLPYPFGKEKRDLSKNTVLKFNEAVKKKYLKKNYNTLLKSLKLSMN